MTSQPSPRHLVIRWKTLKGSTVIIAFLAVAVLVEALIVVYAMNLGVKDTGVLTFNWPFIFTISPLFHLVPVAVIITLLLSWMYLTMKLSVRPLQPIGRAEASVGRTGKMKQPPSKESPDAKGSVEKTKPSPEKTRGSARPWERIFFATGTARSALAVFLLFLVAAIIVSLLAYPGLVYQTIASSYQSHSSLYNFVVSIASALRDFAQAVSPIGWIATTINNGLVAISPGIRSVGNALGGLIGPLANLDPAGKYLVFQNAAMWISVLLILFYGQRTRRSYRYKKK